MKWILAMGVVATITMLALTFATETRDEPTGLVAELRLTRGRAKFQVGEPIVMNFTVTNHTPETIRVPYRTPGFNLWIAQWSGDVGYGVFDSFYRANSSNPDGTPSEEWEPGETLAATITWMQEDNEGQQAIPGLLSASTSHNECRRIPDYPCEASAYVWFEIED